MSTMPEAASDSLRSHLAEAPPALAFEDVYKENFAFVWRTARRLGVPERSLDDFVQEVFMVVHRRLGEFEARSSVKTWIFAIVRRKMAEHRRTVRRHPQDEGAAMLDDDAPASTRGASGMAERMDARRTLHRALAMLDEDKREAFVLAELEQMTIAEIAEALQANPNTISSRLRAARRLFEEALVKLGVCEEVRTT